jgi:uncharacterized protein (DUF885 family)
MRGGLLTNRHPLSASSTVLWYVCRPRRFRDEDPMPRFVTAAAALLLTLAFDFTVRAADVAPAATALSRHDVSFDKEFGDAFLDTYWALNPGSAIGVGYYKYADRLIVPDDKARADELAFIERSRARLHAIDPQGLSEARRADWAILDNEFAARRWQLNELREWQWDPSNYNVADPFAKILNTEFAPLDERLKIISRRLQAVPAYYAAAQRNIQRPTLEHTQLAIEQNRGALQVFDELQTRIEASSLSSSERRQLVQRTDAARSAIEGYVATLQGLLPTLEGSTATSFRLGRARYDKKFFYSIQTGDTAQGLYERALKEKESLHARMDVLSDQLWPKYFPNVSAPRDRLEKIGRLIDKLSDQHVSREAFFGEIEKQIPQLAEWVTSHNLLTLDADKPLRVRKIPPHQRGVALASIDSPGPYDPTAATYYNVMPLEEIPADRAESLLREYNKWMLPILNIHEAIPGHYAQLVYANKSPSRIKSIFGNGAMVEGWAVYGERAMLESGYGDHTAEIWLIYSKWLLRSVVNTILDYSVHVTNMSEQEAKRLLVREAFQSNEEANGKWRRVQLSSVQLTSYFAGYAAIYDLREKLKRDQPQQFDLKRFHDQFLSYGSAPVRIIRDLMLQGSTARE